MSSLKFSITRQEALLITDHHVLGRDGSCRAVCGEPQRAAVFCRSAFRDRRAGGGPALAAHPAGLTWLEVKAGVAIGVAIALGYGLQTRGLQSISSSKSAFITAMYVPLVPLLQWLCPGPYAGVMSCVGIVLAFIGLILLAGPENNLLALGVGR